MKHLFENLIQPISEIGQGMVTAGVRGAQMNLAAGVDQLCPVLFVPYEGTIRIVNVANLMRDSDTKDVFSAMISGMLEKGIEPLVFVTEAWVKRGKPGEDPRNMIPPRDDPEHEEKVMIQFYTNERRIVWAAKIHNETSPAGPRALDDFRLMADSADPKCKLVGQRFK